MSLTSGVASLAYGGGASSSLVVHGPAAFPILSDSSGNILAAVGCQAAPSSAGCALMVGHEGQLKGSLSGGSGQLILNTIGWMANRRSAGSVMMVGLKTGLSDLAAFLTTHGIAHSYVSGTSDSLTSVDVYVRDIFGYATRNPVAAQHSPQPIATITAARV